MEGEPVTRDEVRAVIGPALDRAAEYCDNHAPADLLGCLFVDENETLVEAGAAALSAGEAVIKRIREFGIVPMVMT